MKKRLIAVMLCVAMMASLLVGCKSGSEGSGDDKDSSGSAGSNTMEVEGDYTELEVWTFIELHQEFYTNMAEKWNEANPDKQVKLTLSNMQYDDMHNKLSLALESGEGAPDVVDIELGKFPAFMVGDVELMDLTESIAPYKDTTVESRLDIYSKDGSRYGLPTHVGATVAFYNTELLEGAGIDYTQIKTWDEFKAAGVKYYEATGKYFACVETFANWMINLMLVQKGGDYLDGDGNLDLTNDTLVEVLQYIKDMQDTGAFATVPGGQPDNEEAYPSYNSGDYAVQIMPFWQTSRFTSYMTDLEGDVAIAPAPVWKDGDVKSIGGGGTGTAVVKTSENADLAAEVFAFIKLSEEANKEVWNVLGFDPVNTAVWEDEELTKNPDNKFVQFFNTYPFDTLNEIKDSIAALDTLSNEKWPSINNELVTTTLNNIYENGMPVKEALEESQQTLENEFN
ncbi:arabinosaccharide transport system substrate-binding protein [Lachnospiraceae bacterium PM6-15]|uniref:ABC transporter substrate-binding protein n=1 Tax=Ohessyouella blattaphilus TaxID=2949333 RepID=A0ABT1EIW5_9FIRM|nr:ABC transporter substrate-binding protein [Ohessyouella blattaphilus]MCP1110451.1 ABC transporter substrate-binding protein [Ohessyouella blattaphilus]MCR8563845.1 ABC transporter substrate-binding protein [Ohessyouella blattaphilus]